jgi:hypothetical protein
MNVLVPGQADEHPTLSWFFTSIDQLVLELILVLAGMACFAALSVVALRKNGLV